MLNHDDLLNDVETVLSTSFKDAIVWEQRDADLIGKYVYVKYDARELGIFMGYQVASADSIRGGITFCFTHPATAREATDVRRLFHKLLIRLNLKLRSNPYKFVEGKSPAIIRLKYLANSNSGSEDCKGFFKESMQVLKDCEPLYRTASV